MVTGRMTTKYEGVEIMFHNKSLGISENNLERIRNMELNNQILISRRRKDVFIILI